MIVLGIETSCDETAVALVRDDRTILAHLVLSQLKEHAAFGGVVPEIAARAHLTHLDRLIKAAMTDANLSFDDLDGVAATCGPGLIGGVMVGMMAGKAISAAKNIPFVAVNHLEAHVLTARLTHDIAFPYLVLLVSGGHTQILIAHDIGTYQRIGTTLDDAVGECFDKSAKMMGLPHPGGVEIEKMARNCVDPEQACRRFPLPRPLHGRAGCDFSFSGLKTAVRDHISRLPDGALQRADIADLCCALEITIADIVQDRCRQAMDIFKQNSTGRTLVVCGGVAANQTLRHSLKNLCDQQDMDLVAPSPALCSDNGAMIAWTGIERLKRGLSDPLDVPAKPRWPLDPLAEPKQGAGIKA
ncbi:MAG: tRNA (adenosine(37)-N6)-threonylcarbamoyltransferase complex transferase subunit TsaD [Alphaproteobacteria bacterium]|nr:tRNA (adenosine(37)-N6)-threonylcarbamoyltransferase complex transferase subunit TsaD [Alphaproteobacteria bacterium]